MIADMGVVPVDAPQAVAGRLRYHLANWQVITRDRWILDTVEGYCMEFTNDPYQMSLPHPPQFGAEQATQLREELGELIRKGAVREVDSPRGGFYSTMFLVPKKDGKQRPVINLKALNRFVQSHHFKMEGLHTLRDLLKPGDWMVKVDLKDAYFTIPIHNRHRKYLRFVLENKTYEFNCLPFGLSSAPWVFTKTLKPIAALLRQMGVRLIVYIDDILLLAESRELAEEHAKGLWYLLECLGSIIHPHKSVLTPAQYIEFLGISVDSAQMELKLPAEKIKKIRAEARKMAQQPRVSARSLSRLLGKMNATTQVIPPAPLFYRHLQMTLTEALDKGGQNYETEISLPLDCVEELLWWDNHMSKWNGKSMVRRDVDLVIESTASLRGWGAVCSHQRTGGPWSKQEVQMHINCLELLAATLALKTFAKGKSGISILLRMDNTTAVAYINNQGGTVSRELVALTKELWLWCLLRDISIKAQHLPGILNGVADKESREMLDRSDWKLNPAILAKVEQIWGPIEVDLFASRLTTQCPVYFSWQPDP